MCDFCVNVIDDDDDDDRKEKRQIRCVSIREQYSLGVTVYWCVGLPDEMRAGCSYEHRA